MPTPDAIRPYVPRPVIDWSRDVGAPPHRQVEGTLVFADISGFTTLTERLARRGAAGAEEMGELLNQTFEQLLVPAYEYGGALIKWGGDAVLLLFDDEGHAARAARAGWEMQRVMRSIGRLRTSAGLVTLQMSVGIHSGPLDLFLVGKRHRELVVTGSGATRTTAMETLAQAAEVVVSPETAAVLGPGSCGEQVGEGLLLSRAPDVAPRPHREPAEDLPDSLPLVLPEAIREHVTSGVVDGEHRFVTTGFVQFQGVDELLREAGPEVVADALAGLVDLVGEAAARHEVTFLASDIGPDGGKVILLSGAPRSHDLAEDRMLCTLREVMAGQTPLALRAGATSGRVFTGDFGPSYRRTYSVVGDSVNLAARLMASAAPGQVLATPEVLERSHTRFESTELPALMVKGKADPVRAVAVGAPLRAEIPDHGPTLPLIGREPELSELLQLLDLARTGQGTAVEVVAPAGLGKSRLLEELRERAKGFTLLTVTCDGLDTWTPYAAWRRVLQSALPPDDLVATVEALTPELAPWLPLLGWLLQVPVPLTPETEHLDERFRRYWLGHAATTLLAALLDGPTVLAVEDAHLMDDASVELLRRTQETAPHHPWLVVSTHRPAPTDTPSPVRRMVLSALSAEASMALLDAATEDRPLPAHELTRLRDHADGNPLYLLELLAARRRLGHVASLPDSLEGILACTIDELDPLPRRALRAIAVLGSRADRPLIDALLTAVDVPRTVEVWQCIGPFFVQDEDGIRFRNTLLREAAYQALPYRQRVRLHALAGDVIERSAAGGEQLAALSVHFFQAQRYDKAARLARRAGEDAAAQYANVEAARLFGRAVDAARSAGWDRVERCQLHRRLGDTWAKLGELDKAEAAYLQGRRLAESDPLLRGEMGALVASIRARSGRMPQALRLLTRELTSLKGQTVGEQELAARLCASYAHIRRLQGHQEDAVRWAKLAIVWAEPVGAKKVLAQAYQHLDRASVSLGEFGYEPEARRALEIWRELSQGEGRDATEARTWQAAVLNHLGIRAYVHGAWTDALDYYEQAREVLERLGDQWNAAAARVNIAEVYIDQGRLVDAEAMVRAALRVFRAANSNGTIAVAHVMLARIATATGRFEEAAELFAMARSGFSEDGEQGALAEAEARTLEALICRGAAPDALARAEQMLAKVGPGQVSLVPLLHRVRGWSLAQAEDVDGARAAFEASLAKARELNARADIALALDALTRLAEHQAEEVAELTLERDRMFALLGIETVPHIPLARTQPVIEMPEAVLEPQPA